MAERASEAARSELFTNLHRLFRLLRAFEITNQVFLKPVEEVAASIRAVADVEGDEVELRFEEATIYVNRWPLRLDRAGYQRAAELQGELVAYGMGGLLFKRALGPQDVQQLNGVLAQALREKEPEAALKKVREGLAQTGLGAAVEPLSLARIEETSLVARSEVTGGALAKRTWSRAFGALKCLYDQYDDLDARRVLLPRVKRDVQALGTLLEKDPDRGVALSAYYGLGDVLVEHALGSAMLAVAFADAQGMSKPRVTDVGVAAALHAIGHRKRGDERLRTGDARGSFTREQIRRLPLAAASDLLAERSIEASFVTALVVAYEHTTHEGHPEPNEDQPPLYASRLIAVIHAYHSRLLKHPPKRAIRATFADVRLDPYLLLALTRMLGPVPPGSIVVLDDGRVAMVGHVVAGKAPRVRVLEGSETGVVDLAAPGAPVIDRVLELPPAALGPFLFT